MADFYGGGGKPQGPDWRLILQSLQETSRNILDSFRAERELNFRQRQLDEAKAEREAAAKAEEARRAQDRTFQEGIQIGNMANSDMKNLDEILTGLGSVPDDFDLGRTVTETDADGNPVEVPVTAGYLRNSLARMRSDLASVVTLRPEERSQAYANVQNKYGTLLGMSSEIAGLYKRKSEDDERQRQQRIADRNMLVNMLSKDHPDLAFEVYSVGDKPMPEDLNKRITEALPGAQALIYRQMTPVEKLEFARQSGWLDPDYEDKVQKGEAKRPAWVTNDILTHVRGLASAEDRERTRQEIAKETDSLNAAIQDAVRAGVAIDNKKYASAIASNDLNTIRQARFELLDSIAKASQKNTQANWSLQLANLGITLPPNATVDDLGVAISAGIERVRNDQDAERQRDSAKAMLGILEKEREEVSPFLERDAEITELENKIMSTFDPTERVKLYDQLRRNPKYQIALSGRNAEIKSVLEHNQRIRFLDESIRQLNLSQSQFNLQTSQQAAPVEQALREQQLLGMRLQMANELVKTGSLATVEHFVKTGTLTANQGEEIANMIRRKQWASTFDELKDVSDLIAAPPGVVGSDGKLLPKNLFDAAAKERVAQIRSTMLQKGYDKEIVDNYVKSLQSSWDNFYGQRALEYRNASRQDKALALQENQFEWSKYIDGERLALQRADLELAKAKLANELKRENRQDAQFTLSTLIAMRGNLQAEYNSQMTSLREQANNLGCGGQNAILSRKECAAISQAMSALSANMKKDMDDLSFLTNDAAKKLGIPVPNAATYRNISTTNMNITNEGRRAAAHVAKLTGIPVEWIEALMAGESNGGQNIANADNSAFGYFQITRRNLQALGYTPQQFMALSPEKQAEVYVEYMKKQNPLLLRARSFEDFGAAHFLPGLFGNNTNLDIGLYQGKLYPYKINSKGQPVDESGRVVSDISKAARNPVYYNQATKMQTGQPIDLETVRQYYRSSAQAKGAVFLNDNEPFITRLKKEALDQKALNAQFAPDMIRELQGALRVIASAPQTPSAQAQAQKQMFAVVSKYAPQLNLTHHEMIAWLMTLTPQDLKLPPPPPGQKSWWENLFPNNSNQGGSTSSRKTPYQQMIYNIYTGNNTPIQWQPSNQQGTPPARP